MAAPPAAALRGATPADALAACRALAAPLVVYRLLFLALALAAVLLLPGVFSLPNYLANYHDGGDRPTLSAIFMTWDAQGYLTISRHGYAAGGIAPALYPLWPYLVRAFAWLAGGHHLVVALVLANVLSLAGILAFH